MTAALAGVLGALTGKDEVPAGTAAARPPVEPALLLGLPPVTVAIAAVVGLVVLLVLRK